MKTTMTVLISRSGFMIKHEHNPCPKDKTTGTEKDTLFSWDVYNGPYVPACSCTTRGNQSSKLINRTQSENTNKIHVRNIFSDAYLSYSHIRTTLKEASILALKAVWQILFPSHLLYFLYFFTLNKLCLYVTCHAFFTYPCTFTAARNLLCYSRFHSISFYSLFCCLHFS